MLINNGSFLCTLKPYLITIWDNSLLWRAVMSSKMQIINSVDTQTYIMNVCTIRWYKKRKRKKNKCRDDKKVVLFFFISNSRSPISGNRKRVLELGHSITYCIDVCGCVCVFTYSRLHFSVGWHERMNLLHHAAGEVANASLLLSIIGVLYLQSDDLDTSYWQRHFFRSFCEDLWLL